MLNKTERRPKRASQVAEVRFSVLSLQLGSVLSGCFKGPDIAPERRIRFSFLISPPYCLCMARVLSSQNSALLSLYIFGGFLDKA